MNINLTPEEYYRLHNICASMSFKSMSRRDKTVAINTITGILGRCEEFDTKKDCANDNINR